MAGTGQFIVPPERLSDIRRDLVIVMNPTYRAEIASQGNDSGWPARCSPSEQTAINFEVALDH
jgi:hypothetical protein